MQKVFSDGTKRSRPILPLRGANLSTETLSLYLGFSWGLLPYDKKNNDEVLFYTQLTAAGHHGVPGRPAPLHAGMEYR